MSASARDAEAAKLLSNVIGARRQLEEDADTLVWEGGAGSGVGDRGLNAAPPSSAMLQTRYHEAKELAQVRRVVSGTAGKSRVVVAVVVSLACCCLVLCYKCVAVCWAFFTQE